MKRAGPAVPSGVGPERRGSIAVVEREQRDAHLAEVSSEIGRLTREHADAQIPISGRARSISAL